MTEPILTKEQARSLVAMELRSFGDRTGPDELVILDDRTKEMPWGWVFFYNSQGWVRDKIFRHRLAGNAPYIVNRFTGEIRITGTGKPLAHYIEKYEAELALRK